jgi:hypothetical protein
VPVQERKIDHRNNAEVRFNGSPETHYEPFYNTYIPYNSTRPKHVNDISPKPTFPKIKNGFNLQEEMNAFKSPKRNIRPIFTEKPVLNEHSIKVSAECTINAVAFSIPVI